MAEFESCDKCKYNMTMPNEEPCCQCTHGVNPKDFFAPKTNADVIRAMSDEELAEFLEEFEVCTHCKYADGIRCTFENPCTHGFASAMAYEWLKSEVKE